MSGPTQWVVRRGDKRGMGGYFNCRLFGSWHQLRRGFAEVFEYREHAMLAANRYGGRVVALLTHEQSKRKAAAEALRRWAKGMRLHAGVLSSVTEPRLLREYADRIDADADALWPRPRKDSK